tara:strand:- start:377 stop:652 length:276 start_codon:yes stop_codon:yes gene_type:complete
LKRNKVLNYETVPFGSNYRETFNIGDMVQWFEVDGRTKKGIITNIFLKNIGGREAFFAELMTSSNKTNKFLILPIVILDLISPINRKRATP